MSQNVVPQGADYVLAFHENTVDLTGVYPAVSVTNPDSTVTVIPAPDIVVAPLDFHYAYDDHGRRMDPRRFAGTGSTPLG